jgi:alkyl hydroperoxide reductase subunit AhpF
VSLLSPSDQEKLRDEFAKMTRPVRLLFFTQTIDCDTCPETRQILDELPPLSDKIAVEEVNIVLDRERVQQYGVERAPTVAVAYQEPNGELKDSRMRFVGTPGGYEFVSLVQAVLLAGGREPRLSERTVKRLAAVDQPVTMQVFTTPT